jgi:hypothetical protein
MASNGKLLRKTTIEIYDEPETPFEPAFDEDLMQAVSDEFDETDGEEENPVAHLTRKKAATAKSVSRRR